MDKLFRVYVSAKFNDHQDDYCFTVHANHVRHALMAAREAMMIHEKMIVCRYHPTAVESKRIDKMPSIFIPKNYQQLYAYHAERVTE